MLIYSTTQDDINKIIVSVWDCSGYRPVPLASTKVDSRDPDCINKALRQIDAPDALPLNPCDRIEYIHQPGDYHFCGPLPQKSA